MTDLERQFRQGLQHLQAERVAEATAIFQAILADNPNQPDALHLLAMMAHHRNDHGQAMELVDRAIAAAPRQALFHCTRGLLLQEGGRSDEALAAYQKALALQPDLPEAHNNLGQIFAGGGRINEAIVHLREALKARPDYPDSHFNLANLYKSLERWNEAVVQYQRALALRPQWPDVYNNMGIALRQSGDVEKATECFEKAVAIEPYHLAALNNLTAALCQTMRFDEAIEVCSRALRIAPEFVEAHVNLGNAYRGQRKLDQAVAEYQRALELQPDHASAHWNLGLLHLMRGDLSCGWPDYEWRWRVGDLRLAKDSTLNWWNGGDARGLHLLLHAEQGFGDCIQFVRYARLLADGGATVSLACPPELCRLMRTAPGLTHVVPRNQPLPPADAHCSLLSLPGLFKTSPTDIPASVPYLTADPARLPAEPGRLKIGLSWAGHAIHPNDRNRSMSLSLFAPLAAATTARFYSLQKGPPAAAAKNPPPGMDLIDLGENLADFADSAAIVASLDLVITVDTALAHLAGAMGKPVWVLLPFVPDWRWMLDRNDSPWYPSMRLFRQRALGDWRGPMEQISGELRQFTTEHPL